MQLHCLPIIIAINIVVLSGAVNAQDSSSIAPGTKNAISFYNKYIGENSHLYNGSEYVIQDLRIKGNAYFESPLLQPGSINYDDIFYPDINMGYDIVRDEVTINRYNENFRLRLVNEKVSSFFLLNHFFVRMVRDSTKKSTLSTGFYDRLYDGKIKMYAKRQKKIQEKVTYDQGDNLWFEENDLYFIFKDDVYYPVKDQAALFDVFRQKKKELKKYLRKNKIKFKKQPELAILKSVQYCDQLKN